MPNFGKMQQLLAKQMGDAPKELLATVDVAMRALKNDSLGEALAELRRAHEIVYSNNLEEWKAEMASAWAVYYYRMGEKKKMQKAIKYALRREPENKRIAALGKVIKESN